MSKKPFVLDELKKVLNKKKGKDLHSESQFFVRWETSVEELSTGTYRFGNAVGIP